MGVWPRLLSREQAAAYVALAPSTFDLEYRPDLVEIRHGTSARAVRFDRLQLDKLIDQKRDAADGVLDKDEALGLCQ